ncbi:52K [Tree shrew adenovirus 1]|uniref:52K n=1 Tax=Tree shrew adenovirus serotype 1 TaxID=47680 RepID=UPI00001D979D|nr:52K [Tree shrew adenovirus 1]
MHPVLRQLKPSLVGAAPELAPTAALIEEEGEGIARVGARPETHPRVQLKKDASEAYVPPQNTFRDRSGEEAEEMRDLRYRAGSHMHLNRKRRLEDSDFELDPQTGISPAKAHMKAADLLTAYEQTAKAESSFQTTFNNTVRTLISRDEVTVGLMHLWDFVEAYVANPGSKALTAQLFLIVQHSRDEGMFKESLLSISEPEGRWLLDLINILQTIIVQERGLSVAEKVAAINYSVITLGKHYARKIFKSPFVPIDKEVKIDTFYMRIVIKLLTLCDDLGVYRNERIQRAVSASRRRELSDTELMFNLRRALTSSDQDAGEFDAGSDLQWVPQRRGLMEPIVEDDESESDGEEL